MTPAKRRRIVQRLGFQIAFLLAAALLPPTLISMVYSLRAAAEVRARAEGDLTGATMVAAAEEIRILQEARGSAAALAIAIRPLVGVEPACTAALKDFAAAHEVYSQVSFIPVSGQLACSSTGKHLDLSKSPIFLDTIRAARPSFSASRNGMISGRSVLSVSNPVMGEDGTYLGYIALSLPHSNLASAKKQSGTSAPLELMTFDRDGEILAATGGLANAEAALPRDRSLTRLKVDMPVSFSAMSQSGQSRIFSVVPLVPGELFALGTWPADQADSIRSTLVSVPFLAPAFIWIVSLVVAWLSAERLVNRHIRSLNVSINAFTSVNRTITPIDVTGAPLEIREIASAFERMTDAVMRDEAELEDTLHQKEVLLREVHHRVKNNLQMIASFMNMHGRKARTPETRQVIKGLQSRVMSLATIHRALYQTKDVGDVQAAGLLGAIARQTVAAAAGPDRRFDLRPQLDDILMIPDQAVTLALLVGEGLMNAVAHANGAGPDLVALDLRLTQTGPTEAKVEIHGAVQAGGHEIPEEIAESIAFSAQLMAVFALQLGGTLEETLAQGIYTMRVVFKLRPLTEGENRNHPIADDAD